MVRRAIIITVLGTLALSACTQRIAGGNEHSVIIERGASVAKAMALAEKHCGKYGKSARVAVAKGFLMVFDCVGRGGKNY